MKSRLFACLVILLAISMSAFAAKVRFVPSSQYPDIDTAVSACQDGDMVVVKRLSGNGDSPYTVPAVTGVTIPVGVTKITIKSETPTDPNCVAETIIDCGGAGRAFTFADNQPCEVVIDGFTIINGFAYGPVGQPACTGTMPPYDPNDPTTWEGESITGNGFGGAIFVGAASVPNVSIAPVIRNCVFSNCHVYGAIGGLGVTGPIIVDPNWGDVGDSKPGGRGGDGIGNGLGAAIYCGMSSMPIIVDCNFSDNFAHGGIGGTGGDSSDVIEDRYPGNGGNGGDGIGDGQGGAIYADQLSDPNVTRCIFKNNRAGGGFAGIAGSHGDGKTDDDNHPVYDGSPGSVVQNGISNGGAIYYNTQSSNNLNMSEFRHNDADNSGGAVYCGTGTILNINPGCDFTHNQAHNGFGGAVFAEPLCMFEINEVKFLQNEAMFHGGAIFADSGCNIKISHSSLNANIAGVDDGINFSFGNGGGIDAIDGSVVEIDSCSFGLNVATGQGGAISVHGGAYCKVMMESTSVIANEALRGGGVYFDKFQPIDPTVENPNPDLIANCTFISNVSEDDGGGLYITDNRQGLGSRIVNCDITDNSVTDSQMCGGGVFVWSAETTFENCRILRNSSTYSGGGICFIGPYDTEVKNCLFVNNSALRDGAAVSNYYNLGGVSVLKFTNNTFTENNITGFSDRGGTIYNEWKCSPIITNCIFNKCNKFAVYEQDPDCQTVFNNNLFYSNQDGDYRAYFGSVETIHTGAVAMNMLANAGNNIDGDPMFVTGDLGDYYLSQIAAGQFQKSPAIDAGNDSAANLGLDGYTTRIDSLTNPDEANDVNEVDLGYHYRKTGDMPKYHLEIELVIDDPNETDPHGTVITIPEMENNDFYAGTIVSLVAEPDFSYRVEYWDGTESDSSTSLNNTVIMNSDKLVRVKFEKPKVLEVTTDIGDGNYSNIRDAYFEAKDGDVILVYKGTYNSGGVVELYKNVHIRSRNPNDPSYVAATIIDGTNYGNNMDEEGRAFWISSAIDNRTIIEGLTLMNFGWSWGTVADAEDPGCNGQDGQSFEGGCIFIDAGASPIIKNCVIRDNYGQAGSGAKGHDSTAEFNAGRGGWGGWARGGAVYCGTGSAPQFINCRFQSNRAVGGSGGNGGNKAHPATFANYGGNWSTYMSDVYYNIDPRDSGFVTVNDPNNFDSSRELWDKWDELADPFRDPRGGTSYLSYYLIDRRLNFGYYGDYKWYGGYGGAIYCGAGSDVNFINCEILDNETIGGMSGLGGLEGDIHREPKVKYELPSYGAGVYCDKNSNTYFENCKISGNVASEMSGRYRLSAIVSHGGGVCSENTASVVFKNCHISDNQADTGGGIHFANSNPVIEDCNFIDNVAMQGGGIYGNHGVAEIAGCKIIGNESRSLEDPTYTYDIDGVGGGISVSGLNANIVDCLISENIAEYSGGGLFFDAGEYQRVTNCLITDNIAGHDGGGIAVSIWADPTISNCTIVGNSIVPMYDLLSSSEDPNAIEVPGPTTDADKLSTDELDDIELVFFNSPPEMPDSVAMHIQAEVVSAPGDVILPEVPTSTWTYGCAATSAGMLFGYYDRNGYENMYTGPTNGGVVPLTNLGQGDDPNNPIEGACSIIATQNGFDGRSTNGHVDDYWISMDSEGPDPWEESGSEHKWGGCTADYIGVNQWKWDSDGDGNKDFNKDGWALGLFDLNGKKLHDFILPSSYGSPRTSLCHGMRLFAESRGYIVTENYNQLVDSVANRGFSFEDYKQEIDSGHPVLIHVTGHTMIGVGYNAQSQEIILHDTWNNQKHKMTWGGYYGNMQHRGVTVIHLKSDNSVYGAGIDISNGGNANITNSIIWDNIGVQLSVGITEEEASASVTYSNIGPGDVPVFVEPNCIIEGWDPELYADSNGWAPDKHNINEDPMFLGDYMLSQVAAGQLEDSPAVDAGGDFASDLGLDEYTTRTDSGPDSGVVDMGYHHELFESDIMELNFISIADPNLGVVPVIDPCGLTYYPQYTTVDLTVSDPPENHQVLWSGSDDDSLIGTTNTVHMNTNKAVFVSFVKNYCVLDVNVIGEGGSFEISPEPDANGVYPRGTVVTITAIPDEGFRVQQWSGTMDDTSVQAENYVLMDDDKTVTISFEMPSVVSVPGGDAGGLQQAINNAGELDTIILASGTYSVQEGFDIFNKNVIIASSNPDDPNCVAGTVIERLTVEGGSHGRAFTFYNVGPETVLNGITIRNFGGRTDSGKDGDSDPNNLRNRSGRNGVTNSAGAVLCYNASPTIKNCRFVNCDIIGGNGGNGLVGVEGDINGGMGGWPGGAHGGAIAMYSAWDYELEEFVACDPTLINCDFIGCSVRGGNGGNGGDGFYDEAKGIKGAPGLGGGWYYGEPNDYYYWTQIYWPWGEHFDNRPFDGQYDEYTRYSGLGGAVFVGSGCNPEFRSCYFEDNKSFGGSCGIMGKFGGADNRVAPAAPLKIDSLGGAVYCDTNSMPLFYDCNFVNNEADVNIPSGNDKPFISYGGAVAARDDAKPKFENCNFSNNLATVGGALYCCDIETEIVDCNLVSNSAFHGGGLFYSDGDGLIENTTFARNYTIQPQDPNLYRDEIFGLGGGLYVTTGNAEVVDCNISMNQTGSSGGGVYFSNTDSVLKNCLITSNIAGRDGAGVSVNWLSKLDVSNCTVANNELDGVNFPSPYNYGGGLYCGYGSEAKIIDSIFSGNIAGSGKQLAIAAEQEGHISGSSIDVSYSIILGGEVGVFVDDQSSLNWGQGNLYINPNFVSGRTGDYFLSCSDANDANQTEDSVAFDAGHCDANEVGLGSYSTRTDYALDSAAVDLGYHYRIPAPDMVELEFISFNVEGIDPSQQPVVDPCGITSYLRGTEVALSVSNPPDGYSVQWGGTDADNINSTTNIVTMDRDKSVTVTFVKRSYKLSVEVVGGHGSVEVIPLSVGGDGLYIPGRLVTLQAVPDEGYRVGHWNGTDNDASFDLMNFVTMDADQTVQVSFETPDIISVPGGDAGGLQQAINNARELDTVVLASGTYRMQEGFEIYGKNITIASSSPDDPNCVAGTIIEQLSVEGGSHGRAFTFWDVGPQAVLNGITIRNYRIYTVDGDDGESDPNTLKNMSGRNSGTNSGVAISCYKASPTIKNCRFVNCTTEGGDGGNGVAGTAEHPDGGMGGWPGGAHGGAIAMYVYWDRTGEEQGPSNPTFINCDFIDCSAIGGDGGNGGDGLTDNDKGIYGAAGLGGGWYYGEPNDYYYWTKIYWPYGYHFDGRGFDGQYDEYTRYSGLGGAVFVGPHCKPVFKGCYFEGNRSYGGLCGINGKNGGADLITTPASHLKIDSLGGAVYCDSNSAPVFYDCNFVDNQADANIPAENDKPFISYGGAVAARDDAKPTFNKCSFSNNFAAIGGGLYFRGIDAKITDCNIVNNAAFHGGGLYYADGDGVVNSSTIAYNFTVQPPDPNIFPDEIFGLGGGVYFASGSSEVIDCNISMNRTGASGGGMYLSNADSVLKNCLVTSNIAERDGAGISVSWMSQAKVSNCTVADNVINGIKFQSPYNYGGGLYCGYGSDANIVNSIFWNNTASSGPQLAVAAEEDGNTGGSSLNASYNIVLGGEASVFVDDECELVWDASNLYFDPLFVRGVRGDYFLSHSEIDDPNQTDDSPAIDAGIGNAGDYGLHAYTTRTDGRYDQDVVDLGYHYPIGDECRICDLDGSGQVEFGDLAILAQYWLYSEVDCTSDNQWCHGSNVVADDKIDMKDYSKIASCWMVSASGMTATWLVEPYNKTTLSIAMKAKPVVNSWGWDVEYYFECLNDPSKDSGWQEQSEYLASGLLADTEYSFRFKVRDLSPNYTESNWSSVRSALTGEEVGDVTPPSPNPMGWEVEPEVADSNSIIMTALLATDDVEGTAVQYEFYCVTTGESKWQDERIFVHEGLDPNTTYCYKVRAQDMSSGQNKTEYSSEVCVTTPAEGVVDNMAPLPNPSQWLDEPYENSGYHIMSAVVASDSKTGGNDPVWYKFEVVGSNFGYDSEWQRGDLENGNVYMYQHTGGVVYTVKTCDTIPGSNPPQPNCDRYENGVFIKGNETAPSEAAATFGD